MTKTTLTFVPAGVSGQGIADVRPYPVGPDAVPAEGAGLLAVACAGDARTAGGDVARLRALRGPVGVLARTDAPAAQMFSADNSAAQQSTKYDGTTLGIHPPGRPQS